MSNLLQRPFLIAAFTISMCGTSLGMDRADSKPNIVVMMSDNQGYGDLGCCGRLRIETMRSDQLVSSHLVNECGFRSAKRQTHVHRHHISIHEQPIV